MKSRTVYYLVCLTWFSLAVGVLFDLRGEGKNAINVIANVKFPTSNLVNLSGYLQKAFHFMCLFYLHRLNF